MPVDKSQRLANVGFGVSEYDDPAPAFLDTLGAAFRQENLIGSVAVDHTTDISSFELNRVEKGYNPYEGDILKGYEDYVDHFTESYNPQKTDAIKANIDREREDRQILDESGLTGAALSMGAAMADPTILVPGGALVRSGRVGYGALKSAGAVALGAASGAAVQEAGLQATQEIRSGIESAAAIGGSAILGGAFGFGIAKFLTKGEWTRLSAIARNEALGMENRLSPEVKSSVKKSLEDIGMSSDEADANATLYGSFYQTMSDRAGMSIDTMMKRYPLPELKKAAAADAEEGLFQSSPAIDTPEFKSWFGDSKVVDADGKPLVVYHGTGEKLDFFDPDLADGDLGIFFSSSKALAREYAGAGDGVVHETYLTLNNPFIIDWPSETKSFEVDGNVLENKRFNDYSMFDYGTMRDVVYRARQGGHDGIIIKGIRDGWNADSEVADTYVAFNSTQIKSVNNRGTFDPNDARILYQATLRKKLTKARGKMQGLLDFVRSNPGDKTKTVEVAKVSDGIANIIKEQTGIDVHGFDHTIDAHAIRHIFKRHGNAKVEKSRGQVAITDADIEAIPELLSRATHVVTGLEPWRGRERFGYLSESADGRFYYIEEARTGRRQMANVSMRKMPPGIKSDEIINSLISTSETLPGDGRLGRSFVESNPSKAIRITEIPDNAKPWLYQGGVKGSIHLPKGPDSKAVISLFETANKSTFLHETGHFFLSVMDDMARAGDAPSDIKGMRDTVRGWWKDNGDAIATEAGEGHSKADIEDWLEFGTTGDAAKDEAISRATHEQFARAFETYLGTGKAPTPELKNVFERFAEWLKEVYGNLANLNVQPSDEVRKVFDDMLAYDDPVDVIDIGVSRMQSVGASSVDEIDISDLGVGGGKPAQSVAKATEYLAINPGVQTMYSPSKTVRTTYQQMVDNGIYTKMEMEGKTLGPSAENLVKQLQRGALAKWIGETKDLWKQARKAGWDGTKKDFYTRIARAARRGDTDEFGNEFVSKAAQNAREYIFDPTLQQAIDAGLLPDDVHVTTAMSYLTRMWNRQMLIAQEDKFRAIAKRYFSDMLDKVQFRQDEAKAGKTVVRALDAEEKLQQALSRLDSFEVRLKEREAVRADKLGAIKQKESARTKLLSSRPSRDVLKAVSEAKDSDTLITVMKGIPKAPKAVKKPLLAKLKAMGGVDKNSMLADELRAIGVSSHTAPGLFKANGGLKAVDNLVASEDDLFRNFPTDANGYVNQEAILDAIADEMAGNPIRSDEGISLRSCGRKHF
ncbi:hypothetical protein [uncultured Cohaesibacter sp.]|uniref:ADP-ribosyltransferase-containing protein n=1 Tax=uncultured Cohaesibacter sp. TaxID=1002546 RepID=UPI00292EFA9F|nr:hypothetical protein [uncultured Cohaesibacter sp.]